MGPKRYPHYPQVVKLHIYDGDRGCDYGEGGDDDDDMVYLYLQIIKLGMGSLKFAFCCWVPYIIY
jgi:hypothetical protein